MEFWPPFLQVLAQHWVPPTLICLSGLQVKIKKSLTTKGLKFMLHCTAEVSQVDSLCIQTSVSFQCKLQLQKWDSCRKSVFLLSKAVWSRHWPCSASQADIYLWSPKDALVPYFPADVILTFALLGLTLHLPSFYYTGPTWTESLIYSGVCQPLLERFS